jgi:hypothetical protein
MSATSLGFLSTLFTTACLAALAASDPKRLGGRRSSLGKLRPLATIAAVLPGALLLAMGLGVAFLIWLGSAAVLGWIVAAVFSAVHTENNSQSEGRSATNGKPERP